MKKAGKLPEFYGSTLQKKEFQSVFKIKRAFSSRWPELNKAAQGNFHQKLEQHESPKIPPVNHD